MNSNDFLGKGIRFPMMRVGSDFLSSSGEDKVISSIPYILLTESDGPDAQGEQPWDTGFGSRLRSVKFSTLSGEELTAFVREFVVESLARNEPRVVVDLVEVNKIISGEGNRVEILVGCGLIDRDNQANDVRIQSGFDIEFNLPF